MHYGVCMTTTICNRSGSGIEKSVRIRWNLSKHEPHQFGLNVSFKHLRSYHDGAVPACSSGILTNVLPHRNTMPHDTHPVTVYRHGANLSLCYPLMCNFKLEYTATHFNVLGNIFLGLPLGLSPRKERCRTCEAPSFVRPWKCSVLRRVAFISRFTSSWGLCRGVGLLYWVIKTVSRV